MPRKRAKNSFGLLTRLSSCETNIDDQIVLGLEYIWLAPGFVREVVDIYYAWEGKDGVPMKIQELMMVLQIEVDRRYKPHLPPQETQKPKIKILRDTRLG
jgi:hypothetical protein